MAIWCIVDHVGMGSVAQQNTLASKLNILNVQDTEHIFFSLNCVISVFRESFRKQMDIHIAEFPTIGEEHVEVLMVP